MKTVSLNAIFVALFDGVAKIDLTVTSVGITYSSLGGVTGAMSNVKAGLIVEGEEKILEPGNYIVTLKADGVVGLEVAPVVEKPGKKAKKISPARTTGSAFKPRASTWG